MPVASAGTDDVGLVSVGAVGALGERQDEQGERQGESRISDSEGSTLVVACDGKKGRRVRPRVLRVAGRF